MKRKIKLILTAFIIIFCISGCLNKSNSTSELSVPTSSRSNSNMESIESSKNSSDSIETGYSSYESFDFDISGDYYDNRGEKAQVSKISDNNWTISYPTFEGIATANFLTNWRKIDNVNKSITEMKKSDGYSGFTIEIQITSSNEKSIKMTDGNSSHELNFSSQKTKEESSIGNKYDSILNGDLETFEGEYSNDSVEKAIADSGFTLFGYKPEDYFKNITSVFQRISKGTKIDKDWAYWNGAMHANYQLNQNKLPKKINDYYEVYFLGANTVAIENKEFILTLVPPNMKGPYGSRSEEKRLFYGVNNQIIVREYHDKWWEAYQ